MRAKNVFPFKMYTILVVDDTPSDLKLIQGILKNNFNVLCASSPTQALSAAKKQKIDLVLIDQMLPEMSGLALQAELLKIQPELRFIMVTALESSKLATRSLKSAGTIDHILKPFKSPELSSAVKSAVMYIHALKEKAKSEQVAREALEELRLYKKKYGELNK